MNTGDVLTLAINALRDVAESKRMPSGISVTEEIAAFHEDAAQQLETWRSAVRRRERLEVLLSEDGSNNPLWHTRLDCVVPSGLILA